MKTATLFISFLLLGFIGLLLASFLTRSYKYKEGLEDKKEDDKDKPFDLSKIGIFGTSLFPSSRDSDKPSLSVGTSLYGANGEIIIVKTDKLGNNYLEMTKTRTSNAVIFELDSKNSDKYNGPNSMYATVFKLDKQPALKVFDTGGTVTMYTIDGVRSNLDNDAEDEDDDDEKYKNDSNSRSYSRHRQSSKRGYNTSDYTPVNYNTTLSSNLPTEGGFIDSLFNKNSNSNSRNSNSNSNSNILSMSSASNQNIYSSSLPKGIPGSQIPPGQEDLYVLKSQIVPPSCPTCPTCPAFSPASSSDTKSMSTTSMMPAPQQQQPKETCPPCPSCARCPEPAFDCKKVPNYNAMNNEFLPIPVLNDFSSFGM
jgi:hypothetical protein